MTKQMQTLAGGKLVLVLEGGYELNPICDATEMCLRTLLGEEVGIVYLLMLKIILTFELSAVYAMCRLVRRNFKFKKVGYTCSVRYLCCRSVMLLRCMYATWGSYRESV